MRKSSQAPSRAPCSGAEAAQPNPSDARWVVHSQGQAQAMVGAPQHLVVSTPGDSPASGTTTPPPAARPLRRTFRGEPGQVSLARDFVRRYLIGRDCSAEALQDILVCASELAANAVLHSRSGLPGGHFSVEVALHAGRWLRVTVEDSGGPWTERDTDEQDAEFGRGLHVVSALSEDMGITGDAFGRMAWFSYRLSTGDD